MTEQAKKAIVPVLWHEIGFVVVFDSYQFWYQRDQHVGDGMQTFTVIILGTF